MVSERKSVFQNQEDTNALNREEAAATELQPEYERGPEKGKDRNRPRVPKTVRMIAVLLVICLLAAGFAGYALWTEGIGWLGGANSPGTGEDTLPETYISSTTLSVNGQQRDTYTASSSRTIHFGTDSDYTQVQGITAFRGNNYRNSASFGTIAPVRYQLQRAWSYTTGVLKDADGNVWSGNGWTGQPVIATWTAEQRTKMTSLAEWTGELESLTEVIYPSMDGRIYFFDLETGRETREPLDLGFVFKGTAALDPRGYPLLYIGAGADSITGKSRVFIINLLNDTVLYTFGYYEPFSDNDYSGWDASPLVDSKTDQLLYPGENGIVYIIHLNSFYNLDTGIVSVSPDNIVKWKYNSIRATEYTFWEGFQSSPVCWDGYLYVADEGGNLMCLDLNTLKLLWVCDIQDDTNCTPVLAVEGNRPYLYIGTSFHPGWRAEDAATVPFWKIDALTGEKIWDASYTCYNVGSITSGVQGTAALGKNALENYIYIPFSGLSTDGSSKLIALERKTGSLVWEYDTADACWSSPVDVYDVNGNGYIVFATGSGTLVLLDGKTGEVKSELKTNETFEASPAVYNSRIVIGSRNQHILAVDIT